MKIEMKHTKESGFSFVELSIVIAIIALITASIVTGQSAITAARLRSVIVDYQTYFKAISNFYEKYNQLPGDMTNASSYWPTCTSAAGDGGTCNGDGNGIIGDSTSEYVRVWQHLYLGGFLTTAYTGFGTLIPGVNLPGSKYPSGVFYFRTDACYNIGYAYSALTFTDLGDLTGIYGPMNPAEAYYVDMKMDDSRPMTGNLIARSSDTFINCGTMALAFSCVNSANNTYYVNNSAHMCQLQYILNGISR